jgi:hypothetical protein
MSVGTRPASHGQLARFGGDMSAYVIFDVENSRRSIILEFPSVAVAVEGLP